MNEYPFDIITISNVDDSIAKFSIEENGIDYIINRIKKYKNIQVLSEDIESEEQSELT